MTRPKPSPFPREVEQLAARADRIREVLDAESGYRSATDPRERPVFALDFDVVFQHLHAGQADDWRSTQATEAFIGGLLDDPGHRFTLTPASLAEFMGHTSDLMREYSTAMADELAAQPVSEPEAQRLRLRSFAQAAGSLATAWEKARRLLRADNHVVFGELYPDSGIHALPDWSVLATCAERVARTSPRPRPQHYVDCLNFHVILSARARGKPLSLVSISPTLPYLLAPDVHPGAVIDPRTAIVRMGLSRASQQDVVTLRQALDRLHDLSGDSLEAVEEADRRLTELSFALIGIHDAVRRSWSRPTADIPDDIDFDRLADLARSTAEEAQRTFLHFLEAARPSLQDSARYMTAATRLIGDEQPAADLLRFAAARDVNVQFIHAGATGSMVIQAVEAYRSSAAALTRAGKEDVAGRMNELVEAVLAAPLTDAEKKTVLREMAELADDAAGNSKLTESAARVWRGIKEIVSTVPQAINAWNAVAKLLS